MCFIGRRRPCRRGYICRFGMLELLKMMKMVTMVKSVKMVKSLKMVNMTRYMFKQVKNDRSIIKNTHCSLQFRQPVPTKFQKNLNKSFINS